MGRIPDEDVQKVRDATDVVAVVSESVVLKKKGRLFWGLCPFHGEKTPSFKVDPSTQLWHCFGCGEGGDVFGFLMRVERLDFPEAVKRLAERAHVEVREERGRDGGGGGRERAMAACASAADHYHRELTTSKDPGALRARRYLASRGFNIDVAKDWRLGYAPSGRDWLVRRLRREGVSDEEMLTGGLAVREASGRLKDRFFDRVMFPIADPSGKTIAFGGRVLGEGTPKYLNSAETSLFRKSATLYGLDSARREVVRSGEVVIVEGYTDVIALHVVGMTNVVATLGTALTAEHVKLLSRFAKTVVCLFDGDEAGQRAADRATEYLDFQSTPESKTGMDLRVAVLPMGKDPADLVGEYGRIALDEVLGKAVPLLRFVIDRRLEAHDLGTPEGRSAALASAARVLATIRGSLLAQDYANHVAERLLTDYVTVQRAMLVAKPETSPQRECDEPGDAASASLSGADPQSRAELELVRIAAAEPQNRGKARELLDACLVADPLNARLLQAVVDAGDATGGELFDVVTESVPEARQLLPALLVSEEVACSTKALAELSVRLQEYGVRRQIIQVQARMESLDPLKDRDAYDDAFREVATLQVELEALRRAREAAEA